MDYQEELMQKQAWAEHKAAQGGLYGAGQRLSAASEAKERTRMLLRWYGELLMIPLDSEWRSRHQGLYAAVRDALAEDTGVDPEMVQTFCEAVGQS